MRRIVNAAEGLIHNPIGLHNMTFNASHLAELDEWSKPNVIECSPTEAAQIRKRFDHYKLQYEAIPSDTSDSQVFSVRDANGPPAVVRLFRVPCNLIGKLLDHGKATVPALHMLAIKTARFNFPEGALNERLLKKQYGIGRRGFQAGMRLLKKTEVIDRRQSGRRTYARELVAGASPNFVLIPETLLAFDSALVAFTLAVNLSPEPVRPGKVARRLGITAAGTYRNLAREAGKTGCVATAVLARGAVWLARRGCNFELVKNVPATNVPAKNVPAHRGMKECTVNERSSLGESTPGAEAPRSDVVGANFEDTTDVLSDWKAGSYFKERFHGWEGLPWLSKQPLALNLETWRGYLQRFGGAPVNLGTAATLQQVSEIAHYLRLHSHQSIELWRIPMAFAAAVCRSSKRGKVIRSLGFIVRALARQTDNGDFAWAYDFQPSIPDKEFAGAFAQASYLVEQMEAAGFPCVRRELLSTNAVEDLSSLLRKYSADAVNGGVGFCLHTKRIPGKNRSVIGWSYFDQEFAACFKASVPRQHAVPQPARTNKADWRTSHAASRAQHIAAREARHAEVKKVADAAIALLRERGKEADPHRLQIRSQLDDLSSRLARNEEPSEVVQAAVLRWLASNPERKTVTAWSNFGWAIREELASRRPRAA